MQPAVLQLQYEVPPDVTRYIDLASDLSRVNRRLYAQGRNYAIASIDIIQDLGGKNTGCELTVHAAPNTWTVQNAHVKGEAMWNEMNDQVLDDQPSIAGKWADFKVHLLEDHATANTLKCRSGSGGAWPTTDIEWAYSQYIIPHHTDAADPAPADPTVAVVHLCGQDDVAGVIHRYSLVNAYELARATVQDPMPNVPSTNPSSFFSELMDLGGQEEDLSEVIIDANDLPPYSNTIGNYPGGAGFANQAALVVVGKTITTEFQPTASIGSFVAPCGLLRVASTVEHEGEDDPENFKLFVNLVPGGYKGCLSEAMGQ